MALYHFKVSLVRRKAGQKATRTAAYKFGEPIACARSGEVFRYDRMTRVIWKRTFAPAGAPDWVFDRAFLWNAVEHRETRTNSQVAKHYQLALPEELGTQDHVAMLEAFALHLVERFDLVADCAIHLPRREGDVRNITAVVMIPTRRLEGGVFTTKVRELDVLPGAAVILTELRKLWADIQNAALERAGVAARVDHRTLEDQRLEAERAGDMEAARVLDRMPQGKLDRVELQQKRRKAQRERMVGGLG